jgi:hypothetical protein
MPVLAFSLNDDLSRGFTPIAVSAMQKRNILGVTSWYVIILNQQGVG